MIKKNKLVTILVLLLALLLTAIGITIFVACGIGSDTLTVLLDGINQTSGISLGVASFTINLLLVLLACLVNRKKLGWSSVLFSVGIGFFIDLVHPLIQLLPINEQPFLTKLILVLFANLCFSTTYALLINYGNGMYALDAILYFLEDKIGLSYPYGRIFFDFLFLLSGFCLGGVIGIGTIVALGLTGPGTNFILKIIRRLTTSSK